MFFLPTFKGVAPASFYLDGQLGWAVKVDSFQGKFVPDPKMTPEYIEIWELAQDCIIQQLGYSRSR